MTSSNVVAIVTGSDTVSTAAGCVESLVANLPTCCDIVVAYSLAPASVGERVLAAAGERPVTLMESETWLRQNEWRNRILADLPQYEHYLIIDLDSLVEPGFVERCLETHNETGADIVGAMVYYDEGIDYGRERHKVIHFAGGEGRFRPDTDGRPGMDQVHHFEGKSLEDVRSQLGETPWETRLIEFHGVSLTRRAVEALTPLDARLLAMENFDFSLQAIKLGLKQVMDPRLGIIYVGAAHEVCDVPAYTRHWGTGDVEASTRYFAAKYGLPPDGETVAFQSSWNRRHYEDIGVVRRAGCPQPELKTLYDHPFAQTWPQLIRQLLNQGWTANELETVKRCHAIGRRLADGRYCANGKPLEAHLIGTASILAAYGAPPVMIQCALTHADDGAFKTDFENTDTAGQLRQGLGDIVYRMVYQTLRHEFAQSAAPETVADVDCYSLVAARALLLGSAGEIEDSLDGARALSRDGDNRELLLAHARTVLPRLGFEALLRALQATIVLDTKLSSTVPGHLVDNHDHSYTLANQADVIALPDDKWVAVASFLRREGREADVIAAPSEFNYLCRHLDGELLSDAPWEAQESQAIVILHKGRLEQQRHQALAALMSAKPIFANDVFVLFSQCGIPITGSEMVHVEPVRAMNGNENARI